MFKHKRNIIRYKVNSGFIAQKVGNKTTIFSGEDSLLLTLNETGGLIFKYLKYGWDIEKISKKITERYNINQEKVRMDIEEFIKELLSKQIISKN